MYTVDDQDRVIALGGLPQSSIGAPLPSVIATEHKTALIYLCEPHDPDWDGMSVRIVSEDSTIEHIAVIRFNHCLAHMFGPPNDEAFDGHPLAQRGLRPYAAFKVQHSSWLRALERMNSVHPQHVPGLFSDYQHYIFAFHDSTFECIAKTHQCDVVSGSIRSVLQDIARGI